MREIRPTPVTSPPRERNDNNNTSQSQSQAQIQWTPHSILLSSYKSLGTPPSVKHQFKNYLLTSTQTLTSLLSILLSEPAGKTGIFDYSLQIDMHDLISIDVVLGNMLLRHSETLLPLLEEAIVSSQEEILKRWDDFVNVIRLERQLVQQQQQQEDQAQLNYECEHQDDVNQKRRHCKHHSLSLSSSSSSALASLLLSSSAEENNTNNNHYHPQKQPIIKGINGTRVHARLIHLPPHYTNCKPSLSSLSSHDVGKILQISGTVVRTSKVQMYQSQRAYRCGNDNGNDNGKDNNNGCGCEFVIKADLQQWNNALIPPSRCPNTSCKNKHFVPLKENHCRSDYQEIKLQESIMNNNSNSSGGGGGGRVTSSIPKTLLIKLQHDLVDQCQPGDDVVVVGTLISHWMNNLVQMGDVQIGMAMDAHSIRVSNGGSNGGTTSSNGGGNNGSSSWDCIFNSSTYDDDDDDDDDEYNNSGGENENNLNKRKNEKSRKRGGTIREEIVQQFQDFWNDDVNKNKPIAARNFICQAVCPALYGLSLVKMALLLVLIGGSSDTTTSSGGGCKRRNHSVDKNNHVDNSDSGNDNNQPVEGEEDDNESNDENELPVQFSLDDSTSAPIHNNNKNNPNRPFKTTGGMKRKRRGDDSNNTVYTRRREQSHLLIVGDPGCGKSQFLKFATALCPRSVFASGSGTTSAGLTCAAVRDETSKEWTLEAGALVLADRGVCAIDEFSCINPKDRTTIHEAMEQQTLSVAKAGIIAKLNCRATVIAVCNAKSGYYDHDKSFSTNVGIEPPLLSRFDLIFKLIDGSDAMKDDNIAKFLLNRAIMGTGYECTKKISAFHGRKDVWGIEKLRAYIATVKSRFRPTISHDASILLEKHYACCRSSVDMAIQITVRFLESLIRLAQAHASLMHRNVVEVDDAVAIISLMESTVASTTHYSNNSLCGDPTSDFPDDNQADVDFILMKAKVLEKYEMSHCLSNSDRLIIQNDQQQSSYDPTLASWETYQQSKVMATGSQVTIDHYGRLTQKATPSPDARENENRNNFTFNSPGGHGGFSDYSDWN